MQAFDAPPASEAEQRAFFDAMMHCTGLALAAAAPVTQTIDLAGISIRLIFAGPTLRDALYPALTHLQAPCDAPAQVTLHIWDSASTRIDVPPPPCEQNQFTDRGDIWGFESTRILTAFHWVECSVALLDTDSLTGIFWMDDVAALPYWSKASPLRTLLHWITRHFGLHLLHAAVVGTEAGGMILTGKGGIGKSTTALLCLEAGMQYIGDDYVVVALAPEPRAYPLYGTAKLDPAQAERFPRLSAVQVLPEAANNPSISGPAKTVFKLFPGWASQMPKSMPLVAIAMPQISAQAGTDFAPIDSMTLLRSASFTTLSHLPRAGSASHEFIAELCQKLPRFILRLGYDFHEIAGVIRDFIAHPPAAPRVPEMPLAKPPIISVIIPAYNGVRFLSGAVASIIAQQYPSLDLIIVDDGSTEDIVSEVKNLPIDVRFFRQDNAGPAAARNRGIREATAEYLAFLDIDDQWPEGNLFRLLNVLSEKPEVDVAIGYSQLVRENLAQGGINYIGNAAESFPYSITAGLFRRRAFERVGLFDPDLRFGEDTDWFKRAEEQNLEIVRLHETTLLVRRHETNMTKGRSLVELNALKVFKKMLDRQRQA
jgi:hypothetical protein